MKNKIRIYIKKGIPWDEQFVIAKTVDGLTYFNATANDLTPGFDGWVDGVPAFWDNKQEIPYGIARKYWRNILS
jgi:hypothetical protein